MPESEQTSKAHEPEMESSYWQMRQTLTEEAKEVYYDTVCYVDDQAERIVDPAPGTKERPAFMRKCIHKRLAKEESVLTQPELNNMEEMLVEMEDVFLQQWELPTVADLPSHRIVTTEQRPVRRAPYRVSPGDGEWLDDTLNKLLEGGQIEHANSEWAAPVVIIHRGEKKRRLIHQHF